MTYTGLGRPGSTQNHHLKCVVGINTIVYLTLPFSPHREQEPNLETADPAPGPPQGERTVPVSFPGCMYSEVGGSGGGVEVNIGWGVWAARPSSNSFLQEVILLADSSSVLGR